MTKIILVGASGRMGQAVSALALKKPEFQIVAGVDIESFNCEYPIYSKINDVKEQADVIIDFSGPEILPALLSYCEIKKLPIVIAQTALNDRLKSMIKSTSEKVPVFFAPNLAFNVLLFKRLVKKAANYFKDFDIEIVERHHREKKDAPSGTALMLYESIAQELKDTKLNLNRNNTGLRQEKEIGIHAVRGGHLTGEHEILYISDDEVIELKHLAISRNIFATGALRAAFFTKQQLAGFYTADSLFEGEFNDD
ncbi:MAG: 4-hydroxy-tetrahydrodipicolinate reductase [Erysipelotrichales bacterium]|nr:4-hydroxy-tetrahydrodipicolinate reductase [Erysipelotrichales bacterium]